MLFFDHLLDAKIVELATFGGKSERHLELSRFFQKAVLDV